MLTEIVLHSIDVTATQNKNNIIEQSQNERVGIAENIFIYN